MFPDVLVIVPDVRVEEGMVRTIHLGQKGAV
jgi:hypothetical protein